MNIAQHFVIVIEADNQRALSAYTKGLTDLDLIWPQLMEHADGVDAERNAAYERELAKEREELERANERMKEYRQALNRWEKTFFRGPRPEVPRLAYDCCSMRHRPSRLRQMYESIRAELKHMADVSGAAIGPFRMTENQVREMVAWEDGSRVDQMKADIVAIKKEAQ